MTITDQTMHSVCFHNYPVSQLSTVVSDPDLAGALASAPNVDFLANYRFYDLQDNGDVSWGFEPAAIPITLHYGGADEFRLFVDGQRSGEECICLIENDGQQGEHQEGDGHGHEDSLGLFHIFCLFFFE